METKHVAQVAAVIVLACLGVSGLTGCTPVAQDQAQAQIERLGQATIDSVDEDSYARAIQALLCPESKDQFMAQSLMDAPHRDWYTIASVTPTRTPDTAKPGTYFTARYYVGNNPKPTPPLTSEEGYLSSIVRVDNDNTACIYTLYDTP